MVHTAAGYARMRTGSATLVCTSSIGPGATNMVTGAALATVNRLPVLLLPGDVFAAHGAGPGAAAARGAVGRRRLCQRLLPPGLAVLRSAVASGAGDPGGARGDARADEPGGDGRGHARVPAGRAGRGVRLSRRSSWPSGRGTCRAPVPEEASLARAVDAIRRSQRPLVVAGGGVIYSRRPSALRAFCDARASPSARRRRARARCRTTIRRASARSAPPARSPRTASPLTPTSWSGSGRATATSRLRRRRRSGTRACAS